jgi:hypothetical protein
VTERSARRTSDSNPVATLAGALRHRHPRLAEPAEHLVSALAVRAETFWVHWSAEDQLWLAEHTGRRPLGRSSSMTALPHQPTPRRLEPWPQPPVLGVAVVHKTPASRR